MIRTYLLVTVLQAVQSVLSYSRRVSNRIILSAIKIPNRTPISADVQYRPKPAARLLPEEPTDQDVRHSGTERHSKPIRISVRLGSVDALNNQKNTKNGYEPADTMNGLQNPDTLLRPFS